jgi:hypothetical protein
MKNLLIAGMLLAQVNANAGIEKDSGGFLYSQTSKKLLDETQKSLLFDLGTTLRERGDLFYTSINCPKTIDLQEFNSTIENLTYSYTAVSVGTNPEGKEEKRFFHINNANKVEATELYFSTFVDTFFRYSEETELLKKQQILNPIKNAIIHEALHLFDYNETESKICSDDVFDLIESYNTTLLKKYQEFIQIENDILVEQSLKNSTCLTNEKFQSMKNLMVNEQSLSTSDFVVLSGANLTRCLEKTFGKLVKENQNNNSATVMRETGIAILNAKNILDIAHYLNSVIKFPFEKEIPSRR